MIQRFPFRSLMILAALLLAFGVAAGCQKSPEAKPEAPSGTVAPAKAETPTAAVEHGEHGAEPGSHEDWCGEHAVAESQCTRCNAKLVPAFKATGDWCEQHGLPTSQCTKCNPELKIERPPKKG